MTFHEATAQRALKNTYSLFGVLLRTDIVLHAPCASASGYTRDSDVFSVTVGAPISLGQTSTKPYGAALAAIGDEDGVGYMLVATADGFLLRLFGTADIRIDREAKRAVVYPVAGKSEIVEVLIPGLVLVTMLQLKGIPVLHSSAAVRDGHAVAIVGPSGAGKSTTATLLCESGATILADDVLRVDFTGDHPRCYGGTRETRLRAGSAQLVERFPAQRQRQTTDDRLALTLPGSKEDRPPLVLIVFPEPDRDSQEVRVHQLDGADALVRLLRAPRVQGWHDSSGARSYFDLAAQLVESVPVVSISVPWGPPFAPGLGGQMWDALRPYQYEPELGAPRPERRS